MRYKKLWATLLTAALVVSGIAAHPVFAQTAPDITGQSTAKTSGASGTVTSREEVIYANLSADGTVKNVYAVNHLMLSASGRVVDFGAYSSVKNLTDTSAISQIPGGVEVSPADTDFYYQGDLQTRELPWNVSLSYTLDGKETDPKALGGQSGKVGVTIRVAVNRLVSDVFAKNYLLQISLRLDTEKCKNITSESASFASAGADKILTFTVMPGKDATHSFAADVTDFEMAGAEFAAIPFSMDIELPDTGGMTDDLDALSSAISQLNSGIRKLNNGAASLQSGASRLSSGAGEFGRGLNTLSGQSSELLSASSQIKNALTTLSGKLKNTGGLDLSQLSALPGGLSQLADGIDEVSGGIDKLSSGYSQAYSALDGAMKKLPGGGISGAGIAALKENNPDDPTLDALIDAYNAACTAKGTYQSVKDAFSAVKSTLPQLSGSLDTISGGLRSTSRQVSSALQANDIAAGLAALADGISQLSQNYGDFHDGLSAYTGGVGTLNNNYKSLQGGISGLASGASDFKSGVNALANGMRELNAQTKDMPGQMESKIDELMSDYDYSDFTPISFLSPGNKNTSSVQFVFKTDKIAKAEEDPAPEIPEEEAGFFDRLLSLFGQ